VGYLGATHGSELTSVFGTSMSFTAQTQAASDLIERYWTNFAKSGDPNDPGDLAWPVLTADSNVRINFAADMPTIATDFRKDECTFWQAVYDVQFNGGGNSSPIVTPVRH
jgi:carboxylesterase type B